LSCEDPTSKKDWVTGEVHFGPLPDGGLLTDIAIVLAERLVVKSCPVFKLLAQYLKPFEASVGMNGRVYVRCQESEPKRTVAVTEVIKKCDGMTLDQIADLCQEWERRVKD
jgi:exosome complex RNA-binding protein Rrp4